MSRRTGLTLAGAAIALSAALGAAAQAQPAPGPAGHPDMPMGRDGGPGRAMMMMRKARTPEDMAQHLRALLQLRPAQEPALAAFVQALQGHGNMMVRMDHDALQTTPERLAAMEKMMADHMAAMHTVIEATRRFYDQLDPAQKRAFDELHRDGGLMGMHMMGVMGLMSPPMTPTPPAPPPPPPRP